MVGLKNVHVLVVDDEEALLEIFTEELEYLGAKVFCAKNGKIAFDIFIEEKIDVVISDIRMPGGDGISLIKNISQSQKTFPKIFMCSGFTDCSKDELISLGVVDIFSKPFDWNFIASAIQKSLIK